ncbi:MAG TPA: hypothetical protein VIQ02_17815 [Jiangellaceae bacterium]
MTTIPVPTEPLTRTIDVDGAPVEQHALNDLQMTRVLKRLHGNPDSKQMFVKARGGDGTNTVGLYVELVCTTTGRESHSRYFVVGEHVYLSHREKGMTKANWRHKKGSSLEAALKFIDATMAREGVELYGRILLVELEADSISQIEAGQLPSARFRGQYRIEKDFGKYEFGDDIRNVPISDYAHKILYAAIVGTERTASA